MSSSEPNMLFKTYLTIFGVFLVSKACLAVECKKNEDLGERPENIYMCDDPSKSECCVENKVFSCCEPRTVFMLVEQITLWGTIATVVLVIIMLVVCFRLDISYCSSEKTLKDKFLSIIKRKKKTPKGEATVDSNIVFNIQHRSSLNVQNTDQAFMLNNAVPQAQTNHHPSPEEIIDFHQYTARRDSHSQTQGTDMPLTARGVGVELDQQYARKS